MKIEGPMSFRLMIYSLLAFGANVVLAPLLGPFSMIAGLGGFFLAVAAVTSGVYEIKFQPETPQKLKSLLGISISGTVLLIVTLFMFFVFSNMSQSNSNQNSNAEKQRRYPSSYEG